jgi:hypothetical protein
MDGVWLPKPDGKNKKPAGMPAGLGKEKEIA